MVLDSEPSPCIIYIVPAQHAPMYPKTKLIIINSIRHTLSGSCSALYCAAASTGLVYSRNECILCIQVVVCFFFKKQWAGLGKRLAVT